MGNFTKALELLTAEILEYRQMEVLEGNRLNKILQNVTGTLFYLEKERAKFHEAYQKKVKELVDGGAKVNRAENIANVEVPELYMLRRVMDSAYEVANAIRTNISWLKIEINNSK